jgi:hypothetical protein
VPSLLCDVHDTAWNHSTTHVRSIQLIAFACAHVETFVTIACRQRLAEGSAAAVPAGLPPSEVLNWLILHRTGPHVWTDALLAWMASHGAGWHEALVPGGVLVGNSSRVLPGETFGCAAHFFSPNARLEGVFAMHMFRGVWRQRFAAAAAQRLQAHKAQAFPSGHGN